MPSRAASRTRALCLALAALALAGCGPRAQEPAGDATIRVQELARRIESGDAPLILDVRSPEEFAEAHIPGALNIPHDELGARLGELGAAPGDEIVVHCRTGRRAATAERILADAGYTHVRDLAGHMQAWIAAGYPTQ